MLTPWAAAGRGILVVMAHRLPTEVWFWVLKSVLAGLEVDGGGAIQISCL